MVRARGDAIVNRLRCNSEVRFWGGKQTRDVGLSVGLYDYIVLEVFDNK
jgi:hypothetical protein